jgi:competence protein ComEA
MKSQFMPKNFGLPQHQFDISQQQTISCPITPPLPLTDQSKQSLLSSVQLADTTPELPPHEQTEVTLHEQVEEEKAKKPGKLHLVIILAIIGLGCVIYFIWRPLLTNPSSAPLLSPTSSANKGNSNSSTTTSVLGSTIQVYIAGAVQHPGVYTLSSDARIYQLLDVAGGPLPNANLVTLNLAERLVDGQEVYVSQIGETPPAIGSTTNNSNQLVNINTASAADLQQKLHLSAKSAQDIINYRQQHGPFRSIDQLLQVVSQSIYNKIKGQITV